MVLISLGGRTRDTVNSAQNISRKKLLEGLKASLERMALEYVDVCFCHRPDPTTPTEETVRGFNHLIDRGLCFYWATSEWTAQQLTAAKLTARDLGLVGPICDQMQYNLFHRDRVEREHHPLYPDLGTTVWSPLAGGLLGASAVWITIAAVLVGDTWRVNDAVRPEPLFPYKRAGRKSQTRLVFED